MSSACRGRRRSLLHIFLSLVFLPETSIVACSSFAAATIPTTTTTARINVATTAATAAAAANRLKALPPSLAATAFQVASQCGDHHHRSPHRRRRRDHSSSCVHQDSVRHTRSCSDRESKCARRGRRGGQLRAVELEKSGDGVGRWEAGRQAEGCGKESDGIPPAMNDFDMGEKFQNAEKRGTRKKKNVDVDDDRAKSVSRPSWRASDVVNSSSNSITRPNSSSAVGAPADGGGDAFDAACDGVVSRLRPVIGHGGRGAGRGDDDVAGLGTGVAEPTEDIASFDFAPPMTVHKYQTMQDRRVPVMIKYTGGGGFKRYYDEIVHVLKMHFPDVRIAREIVEGSTREEEIFEIRIDGKLVCTKRRRKPGVYLHMETLQQAIRKARQRRRPGAIVYGDEETYRNVKALIEERALENDSLHASVKDDSEEDLLRDV